MPRHSIRRDVAGACAFVTAAACLGLACAADSGDPLKSSSSPIGSSGSGSSSGSTGSSGSSGGASSGSSGFGSSSGSGSGSSGSSGSGGTSSSGGSSGGSGGSDAGPDAPTGPSCAAGSNLVAVAYYTQDMATSTAVSTVQFNLQLTNAGFSTVNLGDVTVRYWLTADGNALSGITFVSYYSSNMNTAITADVHGAFMAAPAGDTTATSDSYLEISFDAAAGTIAALGGGSASIQVAFHGPGTQYSDMFNETNDYSFDPTKRPSTPQPSKLITAYVKGQLAWGCEPGAGGSGSSSGGSSSSSGGTDSGGGVDGAADASSGDAAGQ